MIGSAGLVIAAAVCEASRRAFYYNHASYHPVVDFNQLGLTRRGHVKGETYFNLGRIRAETGSRILAAGSTAVFAGESLYRLVSGKSRQEDSRTKDLLFLGSSSLATATTLLSFSPRTRLLRAVLWGAGQCFNILQLGHLIWERDFSSLPLLLGLAGISQMYGMNAGVRKELLQWFGRTSPTLTANPPMTFRVTSQGPVGSFARWNYEDPVWPVGKPTDFGIEAWQGGNKVASINVSSYPNFLPLFGIDIEKAFQGKDLFKTVRRELLRWSELPDSPIPSLRSYVTEIGGVILANRKVYDSTLRFSGQRISGWLPYNRPDIHTGGVVSINRVMAIVRPREPGIRGWFKGWSQSRQDQRKLEELLSLTEGGRKGRIAAPSWNPEGIHKFYTDHRTGQPIEEFTGYQEAARAAARLSFEDLPRVAMSKTPSFAERF